MDLSGGCGGMVIVWREARRYDRCVLCSRASACTYVQNITNGLLTYSACDYNITASSLLGEDYCRPKMLNPRRVKANSTLNHFQQ